jgi:antitoxin component YwqK of YwqJK toxin-antitoxin module
VTASLTAIALAFVLSAPHAVAGDSLVCSGAYKQDSLKHGVWICKSAGRIVRKERYQNGKLISYMRFDERGQMVETRNRKGKVKHYKPCGC